MNDQTRSASAARGVAIAILLGLVAFAPARAEQPNWTTGELFLNDHGDEVAVGSDRPVVLTPNRCRDAAARRARDRGGSFRLELKRLEAAEDADLRLEIRDVTADLSPRLEQIFDAAQLRAGAFPMLSRRLHVRAKGDRFLCPSYEARLIPLNDAARAAKVIFEKLRFEHEGDESNDFRLMGRIEGSRLDALTFALNQRQDPARAALDAAARSIAQLSVGPGTGAAPVLCTGVLIGPKRLLTNHHCIGETGINDAAACRDRVEVFFDYRNKGDPGKKEWKCKAVLASNAVLDYALLEVESRTAEPAPRPSLELPRETFPSAPAEPLLVHFINEAQLRMRVSSCITAPIKIALATPSGGDPVRRDLAIVRADYSEATIRHGCESSQGSSGSGLTIAADGGRRLLALHFASWIPPEIANDRLDGCFKDFLTDGASVEFRPMNYATDGFAILCDLYDKAFAGAKLSTGERIVVGEKPSSCRPAPTASAGEPAFNERVRTEWSRYKAEHCG